MTPIHANATSFAKLLPEMEEVPRRLPTRLFTGMARSVSAAVVRLSGWASKMRATRAEPRRLRVVDRLALGDKNSVAVVQIDGRRFLVGGGQTGITLLAELQAEPSFAGVLDKAPRKRSVRKAKATEGNASVDRGQA